MSAENRNEYLDQVVAQQERLEQDLRAKRSAPAAMQPAAGSAPAPQSRSRGLSVGFGGGRGGGGVGGVTPPAPSAVDVRMSGFWRWKTVLVPPNAFVVHTRRGHAEPLHVGLGTSFRFDPSRDSYLVVPGQRVLHLPGAAGSGGSGVRTVDRPGFRHRLPQA